MCSIQNKYIQIWQLSPVCITCPAFRIRISKYGNFTVIILLVGLHILYLSHAQTLFHHAEWQQICIVHYMLIRISFCMHCMMGVFDCCFQLYLSTMHTRSESETINTTLSNCFVIVRTKHFKSLAPNYNVTNTEHQFVILQVSTSIQISVG